MAAALALTVYTFSNRGAASLPSPDRGLPAAIAPVSPADQGVVGEGPSLGPVSASAAPPSVASTPAPTAVPSAAPQQPDPTASAAPQIATPAPTPAPIVFQGTGSSIVPFPHAGGAVRVSSEASTAQAEGCVYIGTLRAVPPTTLAYDPSLTTTVIWLESAGSNTGWVDVDLVPGTYDMQIEADCDWRVTIAPH